MLRVLSFAALAVPLLACLTGGDPPGEYYGTYEITGVLRANECGAAVPALDPFSFKVELRTEDGTGLWRTVDGPLTYGVVRDNVWEFDTTATIPVYEGNPTEGTPGCALTQVETIMLEETAPESDDAGMPDDGGMHDAGAPDVGTDDSEDNEDGLVMTGTSVITYTPTAGSNCTPSLVIAGGPFDALPCALEYDLSVVPTDPLFGDPD